MSYLNTFAKNQCFGCSACAQVCPKGAICMIADSEGFLYPSIDTSRCTSCNKCVSICPATTSPFYSEQILCYVAKNKDTNILLKSASGGAFHAIVACTDNETVIFGARWKSRSRVVHTGTTKSEAYETFRKSKYVQSEIGTCYQQIKSLLADGSHVIFTGTPCQVAGLRAFLGADHENLLCVDLVCHGISSSKVLENYLQDSETARNAISSISFRSKTRFNGAWNSKSAQLSFTSGKTKLVDYNTSAFLRGYDHGLFFRPSCHTCPYARATRVSDLTLGDFWGIEKIDKSFDPHEGASLILVNTEKGRFALQDMEPFLLLEKVPLETAIKGNARLHAPDHGHPAREEFFSRLGTYSFTKNVQQYLPAVSWFRRKGHAVKTFIKRRLFHG